MKSNITTTVEEEIWKRAKDHNIGWSDALKFGVLFLVAEREGGDHPNNSLTLKIEKIAKALQDKCEECEILKNKLDGNIPIDKTEIKEEVSEIFNAEVDN